MLYLTRSIHLIIKLIIKNMWKILYRKELGTGEVIVMERDILKAIQRFMNDYSFQIMAVSEVTDLDILN